MLIILPLLKLNYLYDCVYIPKNPATSRGIDSSHDYMQDLRSIYHITVLMAAVSHFKPFAVLSQLPGIHTSQVYNILDNLGGFLLPVMPSPHSLYLRDM